MKALVAFEAVGRLMSFSAAADELCVTPGAVSRHVSAVEEFFGTPLFIRGHREIRLTDHGQRLLNETRRAFDILESVSRDIKDRATDRTLSIATPVTFASRWLVPRLKQFRDHYPQVPIKLSIIENTLEAVTNGEIDLAICVGEGPWPGLQAQELFTCRLGAFCAPGYFSDNHPKAPQDLMNFPLIYSSARKKNWSEWFKRVNVANFSPSKVIELPTSVLALQAAANGMGIALADTGLIHKELNDGTLVPATDICVEMGYGYWVITRDPSQHADINLFRDWMLNQRNGERVSPLSGAFA